MTTTKKQDPLMSDPIRELLIRLEMQRAELHRSIRAFDIKKQICLNQLKDCEIQEQCLEALDESIDILNERLFERDGIPE
jgi:hypothetical protein